MGGDGLCRRLVIPMQYAGQNMMQSASQILCMYTYTAKISVDTESLNLANVSPKLGGCMFFKGNQVRKGGSTLGPPPKGEILEQEALCIMF